MSGFLHRTGVSTILKSPRDAKLLFAQRFFRLFAYGATFLILVHFLTSVGISDKLAGLFMTLTMLGDALISFVLVLITDQVGRRRVLAFGAVSMVASGVVFASSSTYWVLVVASVVGVISPRYVDGVSDTEVLVSLHPVVMRSGLSVLLRNRFSRSLQRRMIVLISLHGTPCAARPVLRWGLS